MLGTDEILETAPVKLLGVARPLGMVGVDAVGERRYRIVETEVIAQRLAAVARKERSQWLPGALVVDGAVVGLERRAPVGPEPEPLQHRRDPVVPAADRLAAGPGVQPGRERLEERMDPAPHSPPGHENDDAPAGSLQV